MALEPLPQQNATDVGIVVAKTALSLIPVVGGTATLAELMTTPLQRRRDKWLATLAEAVNTLVAREPMTAEGLLSNENFVTVAVHASQIALRSHQDEKLAALRNAVSNSAFSSPEQDEQLMFLDLIDSLTPTHLRLLKWLNKNPQADQGSQTVVKAFTEFVGREHFVDRVIADLSARGLYVEGKSGPLFDPRDSKTQGSFVSVSHLTAFGASFLKFIEFPAQEGRHAE